MARRVAGQHEHDDAAVAEDVDVAGHRHRLARPAHPRRQMLARILAPFVTLDGVPVRLPDDQSRLRKMPRLADMIVMIVANPDIADLVGRDPDLSQLIYQRALERHPLLVVVDRRFDEVVGHAGIPQQIAAAVADQVAAADQRPHARRILEGVGKPVAELSSSRNRRSRVATIRGPAWPACCAAAPPLPAAITSIAANAAMMRLFGMSYPLGLVQPKISANSPDLPHCSTSAGPTHGRKRID